MKLLTLAALVSSACAFAPEVQQAKTSSLAAIAPEKEVGVLPPTGFFEYVVAIGFDSSS